MKKLLIFAMALMLAGGGSPKRQHIREHRTDAAGRRLKSMSETDRIRQMFVVRPQNGEASRVGGVILFGQDMSDPKKLISSLQNATPTPLLVGVDQEGGTVSRLSDNPALTNNRQFPSPQEAYARNGSQGVADEAAQTARILSSLGFNWNLAPVADVSQDRNSFIYPRTLGQDAETTAACIGRVVPAIQKQHVAACLKHFPGYGAAADTHTGFASEDEPCLEPFEAGIRSGVDTVLVAHVVVRSIDSDLPASLSPKVHALLRRRLGFSGVIVTDDLAMGAIRQFAQDRNACPEVLAVKAGNDMIMSENVEAGTAAIEKAVRNGQVSRKQIDASVLRILRLKMKLGLIR